MVSKRKPRFYEVDARVTLQLNHAKRVIRATSKTDAIRQYNEQIKALIAAKYRGFSLTSTTYSNAICNHIVSDYTPTFDDEVLTNVED